MDEQETCGVDCNIWGEKAVAMGRFGVGEYARKGSVQYEGCFLCLCACCGNLAFASTVKGSEGYFCLRGCGTIYFNGREVPNPYGVPSTAASVAKFFRAINMARFRSSDMVWWVNTNNSYSDMLGSLEGYDSLKGGVYDFVMEGCVLSKTLVRSDTGLVSPCTEWGLALSSHYVCFSIARQVYVSDKLRLPRQPAFRLGIKVEKCSCNKKRKVRKAKSKYRGSLASNAWRIVRRLTSCALKGDVRGMLRASRFDTAGYELLFLAARHSGNAILRGVPVRLGKLNAAMKTLDESQRRKIRKRCLLNDVLRCEARKVLIVGGGDAGIPSRGKRSDCQSDERRVVSWVSAVARWAGFSAGECDLMMANLKSRRCWALKLNRLAHALNGNILVDLNSRAGLFLHNYIRFTIALISSISTHSGLDVLVTDPNAFSLEWDIVDLGYVKYKRGSVFSGKRRFEYAYFDLFAASACAESGVRVGPSLFPDSLKSGQHGWYFEHDGGVVKLVMNQTEMIPASPEETKLGVCLMMNVGRKVVHTAMVMSAQSGRRVYMYDAIGAFVGATPLFEKSSRSLVYTNNGLYSVHRLDLQLTFTAELMGVFLAACMSLPPMADRAETLRSVNIHRDAVGWFYCEVLDEREVVTAKAVIDTINRRLREESNNTETANFIQPDKYSVNVYNVTTEALEPRQMPSFMDDVVAVLSHPEVEDGTPVLTFVSAVNVTDSGVSVDLASPTQSPGDSNNSVVVGTNEKPFTLYVNSTLGIENVQRGVLDEWNHIGERGNDCGGIPEQLETFKDFVERLSAGTGRHRRSVDLPQFIEDLDACVDTLEDKNVYDAVNGLSSVLSAFGADRALLVRGGVMSFNTSTDARIVRKVYGEQLARMMCEYIFRALISALPYSIAGQAETSLQVLDHIQVARALSGPPAEQRGGLWSRVSDVRDKLIRTLSGRARAQMKEMEMHEINSIDHLVSNSKWFQPRTAKFYLLGMTYIDDTPGVLEEMFGSKSSTAILEHMMETQLIWLVRGFLASRLPQLGLLRFTTVSEYYRSVDKAVGTGSLAYSHYMSVFPIKRSHGIVYIASTPRKIGEYCRMQGIILRDTGVASTWHHLPLMTYSDQLSAAGYGRTVILELPGDHDPPFYRPDGTAMSAGELALMVPRDVLIVGSNMPLEIELSRLRHRMDSDTKRVLSIY